MALALPSDVQQLVDDMVASGSYDSEAAVVRAALRLLKQREELKDEIREAIAELDRGEGIDGEQVFKELRVKAAGLGTQPAYPFAQSTSRSQRYSSLYIRRQSPSGTRIC